MNKELVGEFTHAEVEIALNQMAPLKAPGPDGIGRVLQMTSWMQCYLALV